MCAISLYSILTSRFLRCLDKDRETRGGGMPDSLRFEIIAGSAVLDHIPELAMLHIEVFRDFPYLYDRSVAFEQRFMEILYANSPASVFALVYDGEDLIGGSSARALRNSLTSDGVQQLFDTHGIDPGSVLYLSDSVLLSQYRGRGIGVWFFEAREEFAVKNEFDISAFCAVERPTNHPLRPDDYTPLDDFWKNRGYCPEPSLHAEFTWKDIGESEASVHRMQYWLKQMKP
jgi:GNAT superfamily N-acetyltransferase